MSQRTFENFGLDPIVPSRPHPDDTFECSDGVHRKEHELFRDCKDGAHGSEDERHEADVAIVQELLDGVAAWSVQYCTENTDYADGYAHIIDECSHEWPKRVEDWLDDTHHGGFDDCGDLVNAICDELDSGDTEAIYNSNDYRCYDGTGCCLDSFKIDEYEEQIDINAHPELKELHEQSRLDDVLDDVDSYEFYLSRSKRREKGDDGKYRDVGRDTYDHGSKYPTLEIYTNPSGGWDFVVPETRMKEALAEAICAICRVSIK